MVGEIPVEQLAMTVDAVAEDLLAECAIGRPPVDAWQVAQRLDLQVARDSSAEVRARFVRLGIGTAAAQGTILLADEPRPERRQWAIAHEVGESVAYRVFGELRIRLVDIAPTARERVANRLASCLLLPREWLAADGSAVNWDLFELKQRYATASHELIARRMLEMAPPVIFTLFDQGSLQWRRSNVLRRPPPMTLPEQESWRAACDCGSPAACSAFNFPEGIDEVRCWPVHEPGWRREIMRTALIDY